MQQRLSSEVVAEIEDLTNISVSIWVSFAEIYNENLYDLLKQPPPKGHQRPRLRLGNSKDGCFIKDLTNIHISSGLEAYQILQFGLHNLNYASTSINSHSSRSHCIFTIKLIQSSDVEEGVCCSTFNFCDLAGSERVKKTLNVGDRLRESNNINTSLLVLGRCINNIRSAQQLKDNRLIPFRESKLTQLFQKALMGFENIMMIVNINPSRDMFDESQHVLNFSAIAQEILVEEKQKIVVKPKKKNRFSERMERKTTSIQPIPEEGEEDIEINRLKIIITDLYNELENKKREFNVEIQMEKEYVMSCYKKFIIELNMQHDTTIAELRGKNEKLKQQNNYYASLLNRDGVIVIDSSSEDEDSSPEKTSYKKKIEDDEKTISNLKEKMCCLQQDVHELKFKIEGLEKEVQQLPQLQEQIRIKTEKEIDLEIMIKEAEQAFSELQQKYNEEKMKTKKLLSENLQLMEKNEYLEEQLSSNISS